MATNPGIVEPGTKCKHGNAHYCGLCHADAQPLCAHGKPYFCGFCLEETGNGAVTGEAKKGGR